MLQYHSARVGIYHEVWLSLVERYVRDVEAASSNLVTSTIKIEREVSSLSIFTIEVCRFELLKCYCKFIEIVV